ncbi:MAG: gamma-glutamylcyclotransferase [Pseudomonadota bacterium]
MTMWVFGYGSLVWNPGFDPAERVLARLTGYHRSFCMRSVHHRGTAERPGLVLALDTAQAHVCQGVAFSVAAREEDRVLATLRERELISSAYIERELPVELTDGRRVTAVTYIVDPQHVQYCGGLGLEEQAQIIARSEGGRGRNDEYLYRTVEHLTELGIGDRDLEWLARRVRAISS